MAAEKSKQERLMQALVVEEAPHEHRRLLELAKSGQSVSEVVQPLPKSQHESLFTLLHSHTEQLLATGAFADPTASASKQKDSLDALHLLYQVADACVQLSDAKTRILSATLFQTIQLMHDHLLSLPHPGGSQLQNSFSVLFERLYTKSYRVKATVAVSDVSNLGVDRLLPMTLCYLLMRSLEADTSSTAPGVSGSRDASSGGKKSDIIRLYAMRQGLTAFDYEDESSDTIKQLLVRCMVHPLFLRLVEGRRFLSFVLIGLDEGAEQNTMKMLHTAIKYQLPLATKSFIALYADVYVRAWRLCSEGGSSASNAAGQQLASFEGDIIQDLMHGAIHSAHPKTSAALAALLSAAWHDPAQKKAPRVEEMLQRLYEPILWRAMKAANPLVRRHAVEVFIDVFPLVNPDASVASTSSFSSNDELLQYQFDALLALLTDADLGIRVLAISGISKILAAWWEMLPTAVSKALVLKIARDMVRDAGAGAAAVRVAAFHGLAYILDNVLSHSLLKIVLPTLHEYLFDSSEAVQLAFIDMLSVVKSIKGITYYEVAALDQIMLCIQTSRSVKVVSKLIALILNSYFPSQKSMDSVLTRCMTLLRSNPHVFTIMMYYLHQHTKTVSDERRIELVQAIYEMIVRNVKSQRAKLTKGAPSSPAAKSKKGKKGDAAVAASSDILFIDIADISVFETLFSTLVVLYQNLDADLLQEEETEQKLIACFNDGGLPLLLATLGTQSASIRMNLIHLSALLPDVCSPDLNEISLPHLLELTPAAPLAEYAPILECLMAWGRSEELLSHIHASLYLALTGGADFFRDGIDSEDGRERLRTFRETYRAKQVSILDAQAQKKKATRTQIAKAAASKKSLAVEEDIQTVLHPLMALKYISYLFEHEKTRSVLLEEGVEWNTTAVSSSGRIVGFLAEVLSCFSSHLVPALKTFVDHEVGLSLDQHKKEMLNFLAQAVRTDTKTNLHVHARLKLLAQRANQIAQEEADAAAEAAAAAAAAEDSDLDASMTAPPLAVPLVSQIEMFPMNFENLIEFTSYVLLPMWTVIVDRNEPPTTSDAAEPAADNGARKTKKSKKGGASAAAAATVAAAAPSFELNTLSELLRSHMTYMVKFSTEMMTLGYFHAQCPLRHMQSWLTYFNDQLTASDSPRFGPPHTVLFMDEFIPTCFKAFFQLSVIASSTAGFGSKDDLTRFSSESSSLTFPAYANFWRSLVTLATSSHSFTALVASNANVKHAVAESLKVFQTSSRLLPRIVWTMLESVVDEVRYPEGAMLPCEAVDSTADLRSFPLLLLSSLSKSPASLFALPRAIALLTEQLAVQAPSNEAAIVERMGAAVSALALLAEVNVKMPKKRHTFLSTLLECTRLLSSLSDSGPSALAASSVSGVESVAGVAAIAVANEDDGGVAPMDIVGSTPQKAPQASALEPATPVINARLARATSGSKKKGALKRPTVAAISETPSLLDQLHSRLVRQLETLAV